MDVDRHSDGVIELLHCFNTLQGGGFGIAEVVGHIHHIHGKPHKAAHILTIHIACPAGPDGSEAGSVGDVEHSAELVFQLVGGPVASESTACEVVVGEAAAPHDLCAVAIVAGVFQHGKDGILHRA